MTNGIDDSGKHYYKNLERVQKEKDDKGEARYNIEEINKDYDLLGPMLAAKDSWDRTLTDNIEAGNVEESVFKSYMTSKKNDFGFEEDSETVKFMFDYLDEDDNGILDANELRKMKAGDTRGIDEKITPYNIATYFRDVMRNVNDKDYKDYILYRDAFNSGQIDAQNISDSLQNGSISQNVAEALIEDINSNGTNASKEEQISEWNDTVAEECRKYIEGWDSLDNPWMVENVLKPELANTYKDSAYTEALKILDDVIANLSSQPAEASAPSEGAGQTEGAEQTPEGDTEVAGQNKPTLSDDQHKMIQNSVTNLIATGKSKEEIIQRVVSAFQKTYGDDITSEMEDELKQTAEYYYNLYGD